jgi:hypothetical protein
MKKFYTIEYRDEEGELVIEHALLTQDEAIDNFAKIIAKGILATMYEHNGPLPDVNPLAVLSFDDIRQLAANN